MGVQESLRGAWQRLSGIATEMAGELGYEDVVAAAAAETGQRKTMVLPSVLTPYGARTGRMELPKPTSANLRKLAETPVVRRAINVVKDRIASMDWQIRVRRGYNASEVQDALERMNALRFCLEEPNEVDSFRGVWEMVLEDMLVGGFGAVEMEATGDDARPFRMWAVDGATIQIDGMWTGDVTKPRYAQGNGLAGTGVQVMLRDDQLMYLKLNPRTHTSFGLGRLEVAFETVNQLLSANRYAGKLAANTVVQYALWLDEASPEQHDRLIRWWQDEIEGTGKVPDFEHGIEARVLRFGTGTDADLRLAWQETLTRTIANAFDLPPMLLGLQHDVNKSTAGEMADEAFQSAVVPVAKLIEDHITRDLFAKKLGWREFEFRFNDLVTRNEMEEVQMQTALLTAGVLTVEEVRAMRGLQALQPKEQAAETVVMEVRLLIDNLDGLGAVDYTDQLSPEAPLEIVRRLNAPSTCSCQLLSGPIAAPRRLGRVVVSRTRDGLVLFTGYLTVEPETMYAGESSSGSVYRLRVTAESDDWLLDKQGLMTGAESFGLSGSALLTSLTSRVDAVRFATATAGVVLSTGMARLDAGRLWSENAAAIASAAYARYRVLAGQVQLQPMGATTYTLTATNGSLHQDGLELRHGRALVNDVTVSGPMEAGAYVTEIFRGDGTTAVFQLSSSPFHGRSGAAATLVSDAFTTATFNAQVWALSDPGARLSLGATGLMLGGGDGLDGDTTLAAIDDVELAGGLVLEASNVVLNAGSDGVLLGLYSGPVKRADCIAGFDVRQANGSTTVGPLINGATAGTLFTLTSGHTYVLRMRVYCAAMERQQQSYHVMVDGAVQTFGGGLVSAPVSVVCEVRDTAASSNTAVTVLYDGTIASSPASVSWVPVNSVQLLGSVGALKMTATGSAWVRDTTSAGVTSTRLIGVAGEGLDCSLSAAGELRFFTGRVPVAGDQLVVTYRAAQRAVARLQNAASVAAEAAGGLPGTAAWKGSVREPVARSTEDCANAAAAVLAIGGSRTAAFEGAYAAFSGPDVWPGDGLVLSGVPSAAQVLARKVTLRSRGERPELIEGTVEFANDWASSPSMHLSNTLAADVPSGLPALAAATASVADLAGLTVSSVTTTAVQVDSGVAPPTNGGFEVRRRDGAFGPGRDTDLVLRSSVRGFTLPRSAMTERFYVRMYDGSTPPVYSRRSGVIATDVPVS